MVNKNSQGRIRAWEKYRSSPKGKARIASYHKRPYRIKEMKRYRSSEQGRNSIYLHNYGITLKEYETLLKKQGGLCKICKKSCTIKKRLSVDHCHKTKVVRGLLCQKCNVGLGNFNDEIALLKKAIKYLERC